jgi:hypothetical protein
MEQWAAVNGLILHSFAANPFRLSVKQEQDVEAAD